MPRLAPRSLWAGSARAVLACVALMGSAGCYDWTIANGGAPADASREAEAGGGDAPAEAADDAGPDVPSAPDADTGAPDAVDCNALHAQVDADRTAARQCSSGTDCMTKVSDQCGCMFFVAQPSNAATASYLGAVQMLMTSGCPLGCPSTCPPPPTQSLCLVGMGGVTSCMP